MMKKMLIWVPTTLVAFFVLAAAFSELSRVYYNSVEVVKVLQEPFILDGEDQISPTLEAGDPYYLNARVAMMADCKTFTQNRIDRISESGARTLSYNYALVMGNIKKGERTINEMFELPKGIKPGNYVHIRTVMFSCQGFEWSTMYPPAKFSVH